MSKCCKFYENRSGNKVVGTNGLTQQRYLIQFKIGAKCERIFRIVSIFLALEPGSLNVKKTAVSSFWKGGGGGGWVPGSHYIVQSHCSLPPFPSPPPPPIVCLPQRVFLTSRKIWSDNHNQKDPDLHYGSKRDGRDTLEYLARPPCHVWLSTMLESSTWSGQ